MRIYAVESWSFVSAGRPRRIELTLWEHTALRLKLLLELSAPSIPDTSAHATPWIAGDHVSAIESSASTATSATTAIEKRPRGSPTGNMPIKESKRRSGAQSRSQGQLFTHLIVNAFTCACMHISGTSCRTRVTRVPVLRTSFTTRSRVCGCCICGGPVLLPHQINSFLRVLEVVCWRKLAKFFNLYKLQN